MAVNVNAAEGKKTIGPIVNMTHPEYDALVDDWEKYRLAYESGTAFIQRFLQPFSVREDNTDFQSRKATSYVPAHAKAAVNDVKNAIYQRMIDISREGGPNSYQSAITGNSGGVDLRGNSMNGFIGRLALPELLVMAKVGIYIDKPRLEEGASLLQQSVVRPYIYKYDAEQIRSWCYDEQNRLISLLLIDKKYDIDEDYGLLSDEIAGYRLLNLRDDGVHVRLYDEWGKEIGEEIIINLTQIPFVIGEISTSLMTDIADYQIGLMNLASSDFNYAFKSNFPFYTEQYNPAAELLQHRQADADVDGNTAGSEAAAQVAKDKEIKVGATKGRRYPRGLERPAFIHPSAEPLLASMKKQEQMKQEIRQLINLNLTNIEPRRASAEAKSFDERGLESGLSYIGLELEYMEREVGAIWAQYENRRKPNAPTIFYPSNYTLKSDAERQAEADVKIKQARQVPSNTYRKEMMKKVVDLTIGTKVTEAKLELIKKEIDSANVIVVDPETIIRDVEQGLVSKPTASQARGYPEGEVAKAEAEHAERLKRIAISQAPEGGAARGVPDVDPEGTKGAKDEKRDAGQQP